MQDTHRKPVLAKKISAFRVTQPMAPPCEPPDWQREPLRITFHPSGRDAVSYGFVPGSAMLVEDTGDDDPPAASIDTKAQ